MCIFHSESNESDNSASPSLITDKARDKHRTVGSVDIPKMNMASCTVLLFQQHEAVSGKAESVQTVTLGPLVTLCLLNSGLLPSPKMPQTLSLSPQTGPRGMTSPARIR